MKKCIVLLVFLLIFVSTTKAVNGNLGAMKGADGSEFSPWLIEDYADFQVFCDDTTKWSQGVYTRLETNLDLDPNLPGKVVYDKAPIAPDISSNSTSIFSGTSYEGIFDGNGHTISNLTIVGNNYCGLFGNIHSGGIVERLGIVNVNISGRNYIGGLVGFNNSTATRCYSSGIVKGSSFVAGLVGYNTNSIYNCYSTCNVFGFNITGGLCGYNSTYSDSIIGNSYSSGFVSCKTSISGGFVGNNFGQIINCYFYVFSGNDNSWGITLDDNQIQDKNNFAGFDFSGVESDGIENIWTILPGYMPKLSWQSSSGFTSPHFFDNISTTLSGSGNLEDPFIINNFDDLLEFRNNKFLRFGHYSLTSSINLSGQSYTEALIPEGFHGCFHGNQNSISSFTIVGNDYLGFFGYLSGDVEEILISNVNITCSNRNAGAIAGYSRGNIRNTFCTGTVTGSSRIGGFTGQNSGSINDSYSFCTVTGEGNIGGLVGYNSNGSINNCFAGFYVSGEKENIGGLVGLNSGNIYNCFSNSTINGNRNTGGLTGESSGDISNCYSNAIITCTNGGGLVGKNNNGNISECYSGSSLSGNKIGGLVGSNLNGTISNSYSEGTLSGEDAGGLIFNNNGGTVSYCYSTSPVTGVNNVGGLCAFNYGDIIKCYASGRLSGDNSIGGICSQLYSGSVINSYYNVTNCEPNVYFGGWELTDEMMKQSGSFYGWNEGNWTIDEGNDYPHLIWENKVGTTIHTNYPIPDLLGEGTESNPYQIATTEDLFCLMRCELDWDKYYILQSDLDLTDIAFKHAPIGYFSEFTGSFDGNGHTIRNLKLASHNFCGLFCRLGPGSCITNLRLENISVYGTGFTVGGLCGENNYGTIKGCHISGSVTGKYNIGGLCGYNNYGNITACSSEGSVEGSSSYVGGLCGYNDYGTIDQCFTTSSVVGGYDSTGGLCGQNNGYIYNSYSAGSVLGDYFVGGVCGDSDGIINRCYAAGTLYGRRYLGGVCGLPTDSSACFWDVETSEYTRSNGVGNGLTTAEMQMQSSYTDAGWDFVGEDINGTDNIWHMPYNATGYPMLSWQKDIPGDIAGGYGVDMTDAAILAENWISSYTMPDLQQLAANWLNGK